MYDRAARNEAIRRPASGTRGLAVLAFVCTICFGPASSMAQQVVVGRSNTIRLPGRDPDLSRRMGNPEAHRQSRWALVGNAKASSKIHTFREPLRDAPRRFNNGDLLLLSSPTGATRLTTDGREQWKFSLGWLGALAPPAVTATGNVVIINEKGKLVCLSALGKTLWTYPLASSRAGTRAPAPLVLRDGTIVVAWSGKLYRFGAMGQPLAQRDVDSKTVKHMWDSPEGVMLLTGQEHIMQWVGFGVLRYKGRFLGKTLGRPVPIGTRHFVAILESGRLQWVDLLTGRTRTLLRQLTFTSSPAYDRISGQVVVAVRGGTLLAVDWRGRTKVRAQIGASRELPAPSRLAIGAPFRSSRFFRGSTSNIRFLLQVGAKGRVAFVEHGRSPGWIDSNGQTHRPSALKHCSKWLSLTVEAPGRLLAACRDGKLLRWTAAGYGSEPDSR